MIIQSRHATFNISYDDIMKKYFITSKTGGTVEIGGFNFAAEAIEFALNRVS